MFAWLRRRPKPPSEEKLRVLDALTDYPPYAPPIWSSDAQPLGDAVAEYNTYFFENVSYRVEALRSFLSSFNVALSLEDAGVKSVSAWLAIHGDLLVDGLQHQESEDLWRAYHWFRAPWTGSLAGLNPIFDLGVYMGECLLYRKPRAKWQPYINAEPNKGALHPIHGLLGGRSFDPIHWTYTECKNVRSQKMAKDKPREISFYGNIQGRTNPDRMAP